MKLTDTGEVIWEQPRKEVVDLYRTAIYANLMAQFDRVVAQPEQEEAP